jgi:hypothetical protein
MLRKNEYRRSLLAIFLVSLVMFTVLAYVATTPRPGEEFFQIYVLGSDHKLEHFYPNDNSSITPGSLVQWYVGVTNSMGSAQYAILRFKLGNASIPPPNETTAVPSPAPILLEYSRVLLQNETWEFPLNWGIVAENRVGAAVSLKLYLNGTTLTMPNPMNRGGINYRIIIELWVYNPASGQVEFGWVTGSQRRAAWLQVWFNATMPGQSS